MKKIRFTFHPFISIRETKPIPEKEAQEIYNKALELYKHSRHGLFAVDIEIINA